MVLLFVLSVLFLFFVILFYPKSEGKEDLFALVTLAVLTIMEAHTLWGYITLELLEIGFELDYYARYNFCFALVILLYWIIVKGKRVQRFSAKPHMWITAGLLLAVTVFIGVWRYGPKLNLFAYCSADSAVHLACVEKIFQYGDISGLIGRYFFHLNEALFFECVIKWVPPMSYYRIFLILELVFFFLSGAMFYTLIHKFMIQKRGIVAGILFVFLYVFGYPLNNLLYGYEYLGASVTIAGHIIYLFERLAEKKKIQWDVLGEVFLACFAMYHCYSLLFIGVLAGIGIVFLVHLVRRPTILKGLLFLIGVSIVVWKIEPLYAYWETMIGELGTEATMYRDFWSNAFWIIPLLIVGIVKCVLSRKRDITVWMLTGILGAMGVFLWYLYHHEISSYYYYKFYFLLWLPILYLSYIGIEYLLNSYSNKKGVVIYGITVLLLLIFSVTGNKRMESNPAENYLNIFSRNGEIFWNRVCNMDKQRQELFYAAAQKVVETGGVVPYIGSWEAFWGEYYYALTNQVSDDIRDKQRWNIYSKYHTEGDGIMKALQIYLYDLYNYIPFIMVERNSDAYWYGIGYYSTLEVIYENEYGFIYKR